MAEDDRREAESAAEDTGAADAPDPASEEAPSADAQAGDEASPEPAAQDAPADAEPSAEAAVPEDTPAGDVPTAEEAEPEAAPQDAPVADAPVPEESTPEAATEDAPVADAPAPEESTPEAASEDQPAGDDPAPEAPTGEQPPDDAGPEGVAADAPEEAPRGRPDRPRGERDDAAAAEEVVPGAHLEPDLALDDAPLPSEYDEDLEPQPAEAEPAGEETAEAPVAVAPRDLAADARYQATGKRKTAVARVILKPGEGTYTINGRSLETFFPRATLQQNVRRPLATAGYETRMDVVAKIHGGGVSSQAGALRHGIARALIEADPNLRTEMKSRGFLTRDPRVKERKKAGLKKARKRPQFSKR